MRTFWIQDGIDNWVPFLMLCCVLFRLDSAVFFVQIVPSVWYLQWPLRSLVLVRHSMRGGARCYLGIGYSWKNCTII